MAMIRLQTRVISPGEHSLGGEKLALCGSQVLTLSSTVKEPVSPMAGWSPIIMSKLRA